MFFVFALSEKSIKPWPVLLALDNKLFFFFCFFWHIKITKNPYEDTKVRTFSLTVRP